MKKGFKLLSVAIVFALVLSMMSGVFAAVTLPGEDDDPSGQLVILHTNDSHGRIKEDGTSMGMSAVKYLANRYENAGASVLILDAGDTLHGLPIVTASRGESAVNVMTQSVTAQWLPATMISTMVTSISSSLKRR